MSLHLANETRELVEALVARSEGTELHQLALRLHEKICSPFVTGDIAARYVCGIAIRFYGLVGVDISTFSERFDSNARRARYLAMYLLYFGFRWSTTRIGKAMSLRDHSCVSRAITGIAAQMRSDAAFADLVNAALDECKNAIRNNPGLARFAA